MFCLIPKLAEDFKSKLINKEIDPMKLAEMSSDERRAFLRDHLGGDLNAKEVNSLFESKLLLKNKQLGYINWAKQMLGEKHPAFRDTISKIERLDDRILNPDNEKTFLQDLASKKLGTDITFEEAKNVADLSKKMQDAKTKIDPQSPDGTVERLEYGAHQRALHNYVEELKLSNKNEPFSVGNSLENAAGFAKGVKASFDNSALFNQGGKIKFTNPKIWAENAVKSFSDIMTQVKDGTESNRVMDGIMADIMSRKNSMDGTYRKMKLDVGMDEEAFPTTLPEKLPAFGRLYKASEVAYNGFLRRCRADIADKMIEIAKDQDIDLNDKFQAESIGRLVNSLTGRGTLGKAEGFGKSINNVFFSPKKLAADIDVLTAHRGWQRGAGEISDFAKKQASMNLLKYIAGTATIMQIGHMLMPKSTELDPRSSDFGKIKIGDTRFDISGGSASLATLAARLIMHSTKSTTSGTISQLNSGAFGSQTGMGVVGSFLKNKLSPASQLVNEMFIDRTDFQGNPVTPGKIISDAFVPLPVSNAYEVINAPHGANALLTIIADGLGIATNTYAPPIKKSGSSRGSSRGGKH